MNNYYNAIISKYANKGLCIDTNLLLLFYVGRINKTFIPNFKRTQKYTSKDCEVLNDIIEKFSAVITLPNVLTELSNLADDLTGHYKSEFCTLFLNTIGNFKEEYIQSTSLSKSAEFNKFGLTDAALFALREKYLIITDDFPIANYFQSNSIEVINFNHIRTIYLIDG